MTIKLISMEVEEEKGGKLKYSTLVEGQADIVKIANKGEDAIGRKILKMDVLCYDGQVRSYTPHQIIEIILSHVNCEE